MSIMLKFILFLSVLAVGAVPTQRYSSSLCLSRQSAGNSAALGILALKSQMAMGSSFIVLRKFQNDMIPKEFLDIHFVESKQQNLEDYLALRGVPWFVRKLIAGKMQKGEFLMKADGDAYIYNSANAARSMEYHFKLGEEFTDVGFDGKNHKITITMEDGKLKESHTQLERDTGGPDIFYYTLQDGNLISTCEASKNGKTAVWRREFVKKE